ncbi:uroporphyrinogen decarboxylase [Fulvivirgaceae bacterium PWU5]|uniref:Uroporphyrinogen decarboxylase n=1 Tax=Dawidia cretensis TaxID=2782350 RepID=A0AAP2DW04_9BACT|nr:uroporphyrinogen decarboxylase [Dawidia cretensis]MBT1706699.1 uroporphyrinogen decarboxylase [Dawidia cretensis]
MSLQNDLLLRAANGLKTERTPVWLMRQAGRILPEYRQVRASVKDFKALVKSPELATEVTIQPVDILKVDAAIIFSDILVVPEAMGLSYEMEENKGPVFPNKITSPADLATVHVAEAGELQYVLDAIALTKRELNGRVPLIGFAGAPWTIFSYMIEGRGSKTFSAAKKVLYADPTFAHKLLDMITETTIKYLQAQVKAGADLIQIFDSWAGILSPVQYEEFSLPYITRICDAITDVPKTVFAKGAFFARVQMNKLNCHVVGLDWNMDVAESRALMPTKVLQGNLDPCALYGSTQDVKRETIKMLEAFGPHKHIANLGHGLYPDTTVDNVRCFIDTIQEYRFSH